MKDYRKDYENLRVGITLTPVEYSLFENIANREEIGIATIIKRFALAYNQGETLVSAALEHELSILNRRVLKIGNNINQIAHLGNLGSSVPVDDVLGHLRKLDSLVKKHTKEKLNGDQ